MAQLLRCTARSRLPPMAGGQIALGPWCTYPGPVKYPGPVMYRRPLFLCGQRRYRPLASPQDLYRHLLQPRAFGGLLRLRTTPELVVAGPLGDRPLPDTL